VLTKTTKRSYFLSLFTGYLLVVFLTGTTKLWFKDGILLFPALRVSAIYGVVGILLTFIFVTDDNHLNHKSFLNPFGFATALLFLFCTDWLSRDYSFIKAPSIRGIIIIGIALMYRLKSTLFWKYITYASIVLLTTEFLTTLNGEVIFTDDHPVMLFRLLLLKENFPFIPFFSPVWNAGFDARDFFATGILSVFILFSPLIYLFDPVKIYNLIIALILFGIVPSATYLSCRILKSKHTITWIATLLSFTVSLGWYRWSLKYGTLGFIISSSLLPLNLALYCRFIIAKEDFQLKLKFLCITTTTLMLFWSLSGVIVLPIIIIGLILFKKVWFKRGLVFMGLSIATINIPWIILFLSVSKVSNFVANTNNHSKISHNTEIAKSMFNSAQSSEVDNRIKNKSHTLNATSVLNKIRENAISSNPLILLFILPGIVLLPCLIHKIIYSASLIWLMVLGLIVAPLKPQLELERMILVATLLACIPVAYAIEFVLTNVQTKWQLFLRNFTLSFLIAGVFSTNQIVINRSLEKYTIFNHQTKSLIEAIKLYGGKGRVVFPGFILHHLNEGHIAPLALLSGKPLVASTPVHNVWWHTDLIPYHVLAGGTNEIEKYLDIYNATAIINHDMKWDRYLTRHRHKYKPVWQDGNFKMFQRLYGDTGYFYEGSGTVLAQTTNSVLLNLDTSEAVIKFKYFDFLKVDSCKVYPVQYDESFTMVGLKGCNINKTLKLVARTGFSRVGNLTNAF
jgi:hypothetical protein